MTNRFRSIRGAVRVPRRLRQWGLAVSNQTMTAAGNAGSRLFDLSAGVEVSLGQNLANVTVSAIRMNIDLHCQATAVIGDQYRGSWGIMIVTNDAFAAGAVSVPDPVTDDADWMAHGGFQIVSEVAGATSMPRGSHLEIRNDSMRKMRENNSLLMLKLTGITIEDPLQIFVSGRTLFLLR